MARIKDVDPATMNSEELTTAFKTQLEQWGTVTNFFKVMGHSPASLNLWVTVDRDLRLKYADTDPDFLKIEQMVIMRTSTINNGTYCLSHNIDVALESGLSQGQIDAVTGDFEFERTLKCETEDCGPLGGSSYAPPSRERRSALHRNVSQFF